MRATKARDLHFEQALLNQRIARQCPICLADVGEPHDNIACPPGIWIGPDQPGMVLIELIDCDTRVSRTSCMFCCAPVLHPSNRKAPTDDDRFVYLTVDGLVLHARCVIAMAADSLRHLVDYSERYEEIRRGFLD